ncbi:MAG: hypothetical protein [Podoviridae sp. ctrTa16]|nr:MAG: hypothetical protein [Podoviridae sp. ctrTa16]
MSDIRKISIGGEYKDSAMHYIVGQKILNESHTIDTIKRNHVDGSIQVYIINEKHEVVLWKEFNANMPISIEFNIHF